MKYLLLLFYEYAYGDVDRLKKAIGGEIQHKDGTWRTITDVDSVCIHLGKAKWDWSYLLDYFIDIDLSKSLTQAIDSRFTPEEISQIVTRKQDCWVQLEDLLKKKLFREADILQQNSRKYISLIEYRAKREIYISNFRKTLTIELRHLLEEFQFENAEKFYHNQCNEIITLQEYERDRNIYLKRFRYLQKSNLMTDLRYFLERFQFEDAKNFYQEKCTEVITQEEYRRELNLYLNQFHNLQRDRLMNQLKHFWERYQFEDAEGFYHSQCAEIIALKEYQAKCDFYLSKFRNLKKSRLMNQLKNFWERYQFEDAESFYHSQCAEIITLKEYQAERNFYLRLFWVHGDKHS
ncbi:MAG: hypothetical protein M1G31_26495 [Pseudanabaena sp. Salubria-1]|nr:hypothetical protein [Pseudanabaena sp. Salubria-1]